METLQEQLCEQKKSISDLNLRSQAKDFNKIIENIKIPVPFILWEKI